MSHVGVVLQFMRRTHTYKAPKALVSTARHVLRMCGCCGEALRPARDVVVLTRAGECYRREGRETRHFSFYEMGTFGDSDQTTAFN